MKKIIAFGALLAATTAFTAETTSTKKVDVSEQSTLERMGGYYYGALYKGTISKEEVDKTDSAFLNYLNASYKLTNDTKISTTFRFELVDSSDENGKGDRFDELDQRVAIGTTIFKQGKFTFKGNFTAELPTSRASQDNDKITRLKPAVSLNTKIDDYNNLFTWIGYNTDIYAAGDLPSAASEFSRHYLSPWVVYTNSYLSEKYKFKAEYSASIKHVPGTSDLTLRKKESDELNIGIDTSVAGIELNPYITHYVSDLKAANKLGAGIQIFKGF